MACEHHAHASDNCVRGSLPSFRRACHSELATAVAHSLYLNSKLKVQIPPSTVHDTVLKSCNSTTLQNYNASSSHSVEIMRREWTGIRFYTWPRCWDSQRHEGRASTRHKSGVRFYIFITSNSNTKGNLLYYAAKKQSMWTNSWSESFNFADAGPATIPATALQALPPPQNQQIHNQQLHTEQQTTHNFTAAFHPRCVGLCEMLKCCGDPSHQRRSIARVFRLNVWEFSSSWFPGEGIKHVWLELHTVQCVRLLRCVSACHLCMLSCLISSTLLRCSWKAGVTQRPQEHWSPHQLNEPNLEPHLGHRSCTQRETGRDIRTCQRRRRRGQIPPLPVSKSDPVIKVF